MLGLGISQFHRTFWTNTIRTGTKKGSLPTSSQYLQLVFVLRKYQRNASKKRHEGQRGPKGPLWSCTTNLSIWGTPIHQMSSKSCPVYIQYVWSWAELKIYNLDTYSLSEGTVWYNSMFPARKHRMEKRRLLWWLLGTVLYKLSLTLECRLNSLVRCANASLGGQTIHSWGLPFSEARILTREHVYQKRWTHFRECLSKKPMVFPNCQTVYCVQIQVLDKRLN